MNSFKPGDLVMNKTMRVFDKYILNAHRVYNFVYLQQVTITITGPIDDFEASNELITDIFREPEGSRKRE